MSFSRSRAASIESPFDLQQMIDGPQCLDVFGCVLPSVFGVTTGFQLLGEFLLPVAKVRLLYADEGSHLFDREVDFFGLSSGSV